MKFTFPTYPGLIKNIVLVGLFVFYLVMIVLHFWKNIREGAENIDSALTSEDMAKSEEKTEEEKAKEAKEEKAKDKKAKEEKTTDEKTTEEKTTEEKTTEEKPKDEETATK